MSARMDPRDDEKRDGKARAGDVRTHFAISIVRRNTCSKSGRTVYEELSIVGGTQIPVSPKSKDSRITLALAIGVHFYVRANTSD